MASRIRNSTEEMLGWLDEAMSPGFSPVAATPAAVAAKQQQQQQQAAAAAAQYSHQFHHRRGGKAMSRQHMSYEESRQEDCNTHMFTPPDEGRDGAVVDSTGRPDHHYRIDQHLLPDMSPIRRKQQHRMMMVEDNDEERAGDRMVLASPMGRMDLSTPAIAGGGTRVAEADGVVEATPTSMIRPTQLLAPQFHTSGEMEQDQDEDEAYTYDHETYDVHRQEDSHDTETYDDQHYGQEIGAQGSNDTETETVDVNAEEEEESEEERRRREEEMQSIELARQMMAEEAMAAHHIGANFLRDNADQYSQDDLAALEAAMAEEDPLANAVEEGEEGEEGEGEADLSYDHLLRLGEQIGDVKSERWAMVAQIHIDKLPTLQFELSMAEGKEENHTEVKCQVCQCLYEADETLRRLPCGHCFHVDCVDQWLKTKDTCCFCKKSIVQEEVLVDEE